MVVETDTILACAAPSLPFLPNKETHRAFILLDTDCARLNLLGGMCRLPQFRKGWAKFTEQDFVATLSLADSVVVNYGLHYHGILANPKDVWARLRLLSYT